MPATTARETLDACPTCGARISRPHLSLCAYCGSPLALGSSRSAAKDHASMRRLVSMREHDAFPAAMAWTPPDGPDGIAARARVRMGLVALVVGVLLVALAILVLAPGGLLSTLLLGAGGALVLVGLLTVARAGKALRALRTLPILARPALVVERRSRTSAERNGLTTYFFDLMFEDGAVAEYRYPGRGGNQDLLVAGNTGVAYTRRDELLALRLIRV